jgi:hypothetical protein
VCVYISSVSCDALGVVLRGGVFGSGVFTLLSFRSERRGIPGGPGRLIALALPAESYDPSGLHNRNVNGLAEKKVNVPVPSVYGALMPSVVA